jgi:hypothetical protein
MITKDFHRRLCVGVEGRLDFYILNANVIVKSCKDSNQVCKSQIIVDYEALDLMEFSEMSIIKSFITENTVDWEEFTRTEWFSLF